MKILYVTNSSERAREYQLQTIIYSEGEKRFVKKKALHPEAIPHLERMSLSYDQLSSTIIDRTIKLTEIVDRESDSLTFAFIKGESLESRLNNCGEDHRAICALIDNYRNFLLTGFITQSFDPTKMVDDSFIKLFGNFDYAALDGKPSYDGVSNIDLIFSNIIYKNEDIYLIDYEWTVPLHVPVDYVFFRSLHLHPKTSPLLPDYFSEEELDLFSRMERHLIDNNILSSGFYFQKEHYLKKNFLAGNRLEEQEKLLAENEKLISNQFRQIIEKDAWLRDQNQQLKRKEQLLIELEHQVHRLKDIEELAQSMRMKNRINTLLKINTFRQAAQDDSDKVPQVDTASLTPYSYSKPELNEVVQYEIVMSPYKPLISIIMPVYNVSPQWLERAISSIQNQWYGNWELCIADDASTNQDTLEFLEKLNNPMVKVVFLEQNLNISGASNAALDLATGDYIALMDNDDEISPDALYEVVKTINETQADLIYSDEDFITAGGDFVNPHFKPDFSPDLLLSHNYITHFCVFKRSLLNQVGQFNSDYDGAQDYDLFLRLTERAEKIVHIPKVLYHWRMLETSTASGTNVKPESHEQGKKLLKEALDRRGIKGSVEDANLHNFFRVRYDISDSPLISIIIPFKDEPELLRTCLVSILEKSSYHHYEIIGINNNSTNKVTFELMEEFAARDSRVNFHDYNKVFNYSAINNYAVRELAKGEHVILLNSDIEIISDGWIEAMLEHSQRKEVGCIGAKLYYPDERIQHAGIIIGLGGYAAHSHRLFNRSHYGYFNRLNINQNLSAVTAACLMVKRPIYLELGGLDETSFKIAYNDVDFCLRVREAGYLNIFTPYAEAYHHESVTRGYEDTPEKIARFQEEKDYFFERHRDILTTGDPYYNPNLTTSREDFSLKTRARK